MVYGTKGWNKSGRNCMLIIPSKTLGWQYNVIKLVTDNFNNNNKVNINTKCKDNNIRNNVQQKT